MRGAYVRWAISLHRLSLRPMDQPAHLVPDSTSDTKSLIRSAASPSTDVWALGRWPRNYAAQSRVQRSTRTRLQRTLTARRAFPEPTMISRQTTIAIRLAVGFLMSIAPAATGQGRIEPGAVIRAHFGENRSAFTGTLVSRTPDTLTLAPRGGGLVHLPWASVTALDVHDGRARLLPAAKWAFWGAAIWGGVVAVIPYRACDPQRYSNCNSDNTMSKSEFVLTQAAGMAIITGVIGAVRGADRWVQVERVTP